MTLEILYFVFDIQRVCFHLCFLAFCSLTVFLLVASQNVQTSNIQRADETSSDVIDNATMKNEIGESFRVSPINDVSEFESRTNAETEINDNVLKVERFVPRCFRICGFEHHTLLDLIQNKLLST